MKGDERTTETWTSGLGVLQCPKNPCRIVVQDEKGDSLVLDALPDITPLESVHLTLWLICHAAYPACAVNLDYLTEHNLRRHFRQDEPVDEPQTVPATEG